MYFLECKYKILTQIILDVSAVTIRMQKTVNILTEYLHTGKQISNDSDGSGISNS